MRFYRLELSPHAVIRYRERVNASADEQVIRDEFRASKRKKFGDWLPTDRSCTDLMKERRVVSVYMDRVFVSCVFRSTTFLITVVRAGGVMKEREARWQPKVSQLPPLSFSEEEEKICRIAASHFCVRNRCREIKDDCYQEACLALLRARNENSHPGYLRVSCLRACRSYWARWRYGMSHEAWRWRLKNGEDPLPLANMENPAIVAGNEIDHDEDYPLDHRREQLLSLADKSFLTSKQRRAIEIVVAGGSAEDIAAENIKSGSRKRKDAGWQMLCTVSKKLKAALEGKPILRGQGMKKNKET